jgi:membrane glycosyltransferase
MLKLSCPECGFSKDVPLDKIPKGTSSATCPKCNFRFGIRDISKCKSSDTTINVNIKNIDVARAILYANLRNKFLWGLPIISGILIYFDAFSIVYMFGFPFIETCIVITSYIFYILSITIISYIITVFCLLCNKNGEKVA